jgi:hypothetical integral membrane protein (TIGR02206 family)
MAREYIQFGTDHLITLAFIFGTSILSLYLGLKYKQKTRIFQIIYAFSLITVVFAFNIYHIYNNTFDFSRHLPFHLCTISAYLAIILGLFPNRRLFWLLYFWGFIAAFITLLLPDMGREEGLGSFRFFEMMASHGLILIIISLFYGIYNQTLKFKYYLATMCILIGFTLTVGLLVNPLVNGNYLYLAEKPSGGQMNFLPNGNPAHALSLSALVIGILSIQYIITLIVTKILLNLKKYK